MARKDKRIEKACERLHINVKGAYRKEKKDLLDKMD
jgi:hypothetical protein